MDDLRRPQTPNPVNFRQEWTQSSHFRPRMDPIQSVLAYSGPDPVTFGQEWGPEGVGRPGCRDALVYTFARARDRESLWRGPQNDHFWRGSGSPPPNLHLVYKGFWVLGPELGLKNMSKKGLRRGYPKMDPLFDPFSLFPIIPGSEWPRNRQAPKQQKPRISGMYLKIPIFGHQKSLPNGPQIWTPRIDPLASLGPPENH